MTPLRIVDCGLWIPMRCVLVLPLAIQNLLSLELR